MDADESKRDSGVSSDGAGQTASDDGGQTQTHYYGVQGTDAEGREVFRGVEVTVRNRSDLGITLQTAIAGLRHELQVRNVIVPSSVYDPQQHNLMGDSVKKPDPSEFDEPADESEEARKARHERWMRLSPDQRQRIRRERMRQHPPAGVTPALVEELQQLIRSEARALAVLDPAERARAVKRAEEALAWVGDAWRVPRDCAACGEEGLYMWFRRAEDGAPLCAECAPEDDVKRSSFARAERRHRAADDLQCEAEGVMEELDDQATTLAEMAHRAGKEQLPIADALRLAYRVTLTASAAVRAACDPKLNPDPIDRLARYKGRQDPTDDDDDDDDDE